MLDLKYVLNHLDQVKTALSQRGTAVEHINQLQELAQSRNTLQQSFDQLRHQQNEASQKIQAAKKAGETAETILAEMKQIAAQLKEITPQIDQLQQKITDLLQHIPNLPHTTVPIGQTEADNQVVRQWGEKPSIEFTAQPHWEIAESLGIIDFERATKITGARFALYRNLGARLERALINLMLETHTQEHGYEEVLPPFLVNDQALLGTGQLPKFAEDLFKTDHDFYLVPTAEVPITNIYQNEILKESDLPISLTAYTPCFRKEAGSYGKDVRGLIRQHQFNKVELVKFVHPDQSYDQLEQLTGHAETILQKLGIHYRVVALCTGDLGFSAAKTYDIEVWLPGQNCYREISSCSNFEDFQARRAKIRFKDPNKKNRLVHTLNGSGLAVGRTVVAILENFQQADGSVLIPQVLRPWMGVEKISK